MNLSVKVCQGLPIVVSIRSNGTADDTRTRYQRGKLVVARDRCPHRGVPLSMGTHDEDGIVCRSRIGNYPIGVDGRAPAGFEWPRHFEVHLPFIATLTIHFPGNDRLVIMNAASPTSARRTRLFAPIARNFDKHMPALR